MPPVFFASAVENPSRAILAVIATLVGIAAAILALIFCVRAAFTPQRERYRIWNSRAPSSDAEFLGSCGIDLHCREAPVAVAARQALAQMGGIPAGNVLADDVMHDRFWDSIDWMDFTFRTERIADVNVPQTVWDLASELAKREQSKVMIKHLVQAICHVAKPRGRGKERRNRLTQ